MHEKLFLRAVIAEFHRTGVEEAVFSRVLAQHISICRLESKWTEFFFIFANVGIYKLIASS